MASVRLSELLIFYQKLSDQPMQARVLEFELGKPAIVVSDGWLVVSRSRWIAVLPVFLSVDGACVELIHI
jgi:hypothetical protein